MVCFRFSSNTFSELTVAVNVSDKYYLFEKMLCSDVSPAGGRKSVCFSCFPFAKSLVTRIGGNVIGSTKTQSETIERLAAVKKNPTGSDVSQLKDLMLRSATGRRSEKPIQTGRECGEPFKPTTAIEEHVQFLTGVNFAEDKTSWFISFF